MARPTSAIGLLKALGLIAWREVRSFGSIGGQNLFLFVAFVAFQQLESAALFGMLFGVVLLFPLLIDPLEKVPPERRLTWPLGKWEWIAVRGGSALLSPVAWIAVLVLLRAGWRVGAQVFGIGVSLYAVKYIAKLVSRRLSGQWRYRLPAPPGTMGALMRLQWREMLRTLDPYIAISLMAATVLYRVSGRALDPAAPRIIALVVALAISTETQVLFSIDGLGAERYRQFPIKGWRILLAKDLAFLVLLALVVMPLDFLSGMFGGLAALTVGRHRSVLKPIPQQRWRFTSGALFMDGVIQTVALFAVGSAVRTKGLPLMALCTLAWALSLFLYGRRWDRNISRAR